LDAEFIGTPTTNQKFTSYERSASTGLDYAQNRSYSSGQGRFTSVDPIGIASSSAGTPQSLNLYAYVENNPIDFVDPSGLNEEITGIISMPGGGFCVDYESWDAKTATVTWRRECYFTGGGGGGLPPTGGDPGTGGGGGTSPPQEGNCGVNPITNTPGIRNDKPSKKYPANNAQGTGRIGDLGNIRAGNGGNGGFNERTGGKHAGIDITAPVGTPVYASLDGVVKRVDNKYKLPKNGGKGYGNLIVINYDNMSLNDAYAHLTEVYVKVGDPVKAGDLIGTTGRTGNANNKNQPPGDDHLHLGRFTGEYEGGSLAGQNFIDPQQSLNNPCPPVQDKK
jgi:RHS repeat-associated protein